MILSYCHIVKTVSILTAQLSPVLFVKVNNIVTCIIHYCHLYSRQCPARCPCSTVAAPNHYLHFTFQLMQWLPRPWLGRACEAARRVR